MLIPTNIQALHFAIGGSLLQGNFREDKDSKA